MLELKNNSLVFSFPEVHPEAKITIEFQRTLRIPDDGRDYPLPPGIGRFPMEHLDDHTARVPDTWLSRGGVMLPMYQAEAMWLNFNPHQAQGRASAYPFAIKVAAGKINAASGEPWTDELTEKKKKGEKWFERSEKTPSDYLVAPKQPWLDGYSVATGKIRQFVAMPLGSGYSAEEQITGQAEFGGVQLIVYPMRGEIYEKKFPKNPLPPPPARARCASAPVAGDLTLGANTFGITMGLGAGGSMKQEIYDDPFDFEDWDHSTSSRSFVHLTNSMMWRALTGKEAPHIAPTATEYENAGLPWFDYYDESGAVSQGSGILNKLKSIVGLSKEKGDVAVCENQPVDPQTVVEIKAKTNDEVRDGQF
jgi:hypothetical protein